MQISSQILENCHRRDIDLCVVLIENRWILSKILLQLAHRVPWGSVSSSQTESDRISTKHEGESSNYGQLDRKSSSLVLGDASDSHRGRYKLNSGDRCCNAVFLTSGQNLQRRLLSQTDQLAEPRLYWDSHAFLRSPGSIRIDFQLSTDPTDRSEVQCHLQSKQRGQNSNTILRGALWHVDQEIGCEDTKSVQNPFTSSKNLGKKKVSGPKSEIWEMCKLPNTETIDFDRISNSIDFNTVHIWAKALPGHETFFCLDFFTNKTRFQGIYDPTSQSSYRRVTLIKAKRYKEFLNHNENCVSIRSACWTRYYFEY